MTTKTIWLPFLLFTAACATPQFPSRPDVSFYNAANPASPGPVLMIQGPPIERPGQRPILPRAVPAPICLTDMDHARLSQWFDAVDLWVTQHGQ